MVLTDAYNLELKTQLGEVQRNGVFFSSDSYMSLVINAYIIFKESNHRNNLSLLDFQIQIGQALVGQFTSRKKRYHQSIPGAF